DQRLGLAGLGFPEGGDDEALLEGVDVSHWRFLLFDRGWQVTSGYVGRSHLPTVRRGTKKTPPQKSENPRARLPPPGKKPPQGTRDRRGRSRDLPPPERPLHRAG